MRALAIVFILWMVVRLGLFAMTRRQVRTVDHKQFLRLRLDVSRTKARVYQVLRADPDTGVTVADLREDSSMAAGTSHKQFRKIWSQVVDDIRRDGRVAKFGPWVHGSEEEEVWQWLGDATGRHRRGTESGQRRVTFG